MLTQIDQLRQQMGSPADFHIRELLDPRTNRRRITIVYLSTITDEEKIMDHVHKPAVNMIAAINEADACNALRDYFLTFGAATPLEHAAISRVLHEGKCMLFLEEDKEGIALEISRWKDRSITASEQEPSLEGPQDAFVENLQSNISMLRRRIRHESLQFHDVVIGTRSHTNVSVVYVADKVNEDVLERTKSALEAVEAEVLLDATQLGNMMLSPSASFSLFPLFQTSSRPDKITSYLVEGRVVILMDTSPTALIFPAALTSMYQAADDYYVNSILAGFWRMVRIEGVLITLLMPSLYIALTSVNQDVLRVQFMVAIAASREGIPYPAYIEVFIMMTLLELINEATIRLPKTIGGTATIVGGLIIGTAAAQSHLISNIMIVITAGTAIGSYTAPDYKVGNAVRLWSYGLIFVTIPFGIYGMIIGLFFLMLYLCWLESMGVPYFAPFSTFRYRDLARDTFIRMPWKILRAKPTMYQTAKKPPSERSDGNGGGLY